MHDEPGIPLRVAQARRTRYRPGPRRDGGGPERARLSERTYELHGLAVASPRPLDAPATDRRPDWTVRLAAPLLVDGAPPGRLIGEAEFGEHRYWATVADGDRRWITRHRHSAETEFDLDARSITIRPDPRKPDGYWMLLLAGSGMAHALAADGHPALHASAVEIEGRAIAFIGPSGGGKTTMAALMCRSGARAVTDDLLRCGVNGAAASCFRGSSTLRLRSQAKALGEGVGGSIETTDGRTAARFDHSPVSRMPLAALIVPRPSREASKLELRRLHGREAAVELLRSPRLAGLIEPGLALRHVDLTAALVDAVPVFEATVPWGPPFAPRLAKGIAEGIRASA